MGTAHWAEEPDGLGMSGMSGLPENFVTQIARQFTSTSPAFCEVVHKSH
jgi:hypothetical protein